VERSVPHLGSKHWYTYLLPGGDRRFRHIKCGCIKSMKVKYIASGNYGCRRQNNHTVSQSSGFKRSVQPRELYLFGVNSTTFLADA